MDADEKMNELLLKSERDLKALELEVEEMFLEDQLKLEEDAAKERAEINKKATEEIIKQAERRFSTEERIAAQQLRNEILLAQAKEGIYQNTVSALLGFLGEGSKLAKGIQIADATRTAIATAMEAFKSTAAIKVVGPVLAPIAGAAALAAGMANVRKIAQVEDPLSGGASVPSVNIATPQAAPGIESIVQADVGGPQDVNIIQDQTVRSNKAYVVESEVTAKQEIQRQREADVTL
jgi:hypothetical protein